jgi:dTDP-glucose 4,6-dehydratase/UDP-glucose 4-epimerase
MKILIIGSKGFIGSHASKHFSAQPGFECWGCDVVTDYTTKRYLLLDSTNSDFNDIFTDNGFDICINCSGAASVPDSLKNPFRDFTLNTYNVIKILEAIRKHRPDCKFINLSSAAVYGNPASLPVRETDPCKPVSPYGNHKLFAEQLCAEYTGQYSMQTCSLRIFSAYGPGLKKQLLWDIFQKSLSGKTVELSGSGNETRDFIYVDDIIRAIELILEKGLFNASVYNLAGGTEVSVRNLVTLLLTALDHKGDIKFSGVIRSGDPVNWVADINNIKRLGFNPSVTINEGIKKYVEWLKEEKLSTDIL